MSLLPPPIRQSLYETNEDFPFSDLLFHKPISVLGEPHNFMIKLHLGDKSTPVYFQTPPCLLKEGSFTKVGKQTVVDFLVSNENSEFLVWIEKLEDLCHRQLMTHQNEWFETQFTEEDIDSLFLSPYKTVKGKGGKMVSVRANLPVTKKIKLFNEQKEELEFTEPFHTDDSVIGILEMIGIKCSPRNFHIDFTVKQMMLLKENPLFNSCMISSTHVAVVPPSPVAVVPPSPVVETPVEELVEIHLQDMEDEGDQLVIRSHDEIVDNETVDREILEKVKRARHLGITTFLKSRQYSFDTEKLRLD